MSRNFALSIYVHCQVKGAVVVVHLLDAHGKAVEDSRPEWTMAPKVCVERKETLHLLSREPHISSFGVWTANIAGMLHVALLPFGSLALVSPKQRF
eukprot:2733440-Amphidinium_carterae.1